MARESDEEGDWGQKEHPHCGLEAEPVSQESNFGRAGLSITVSAKSDTRLGLCGIVRAIPGPGRRTMQEDDIHDEKNMTFGDKKMLRKRLTSCQDIV